MVSQASEVSQSRIPLTPERVFAAAVAVADAGGIEAVTMRGVAEELGVEAMSLYYHVENKGAMLDGMVDAVVGEIEVEAGGLAVPDDLPDWQEAVRERILHARRVMLRHSWAPAVIETRTTISLVMMRYFDALLGLMHQGGFSWGLVHHAAHALGSRALGFSGELFEPEDADAADDEAESMMEAMAAELPHVVTMMAEVAHDDPDSTIGWCDDQAEFEFGLDVVLEGLEGRRQSQA